MSNKLRMAIIEIICIIAFPILLACNSKVPHPIHNNLSSIFSFHQDQLYGYAGTNYHRLILYYDTIYLDEKQNIYHIYVNLNYRNKKFTANGTITPQKTIKKKDGTEILTSRLTLNLSDSSLIEGSFTTLYYQKGGKVRYNDININSDSYMNNYFTGYWEKLGNKIKCCWGEFRIPESGDLDIGAGEFSPSEKYYPYGWNNFE